jgi:ABC-type transport system involved in multi-copper enzyme maturation permease subunit
MGLGNVWAVFCFEWRRALTIPRIAWWIVLTMFPPAMVALVRLAPGNPPPREAWAVLLFALVPMLVSMLGTFLWATPAVSTELERRSWIYLATRPNGSTAVILGKYLTAVTWALPAALCGLTIALALAEVDDKWMIGINIALLTCLSCPAYAAVYLLIGALFPRRAMVFAVAYTLIFEFIISFVPAMINTLTVQFRVRALLIDWVHIPIGDRRDFGAMILAGNSPAWLHVTVLIVSTLALLLAAVVVIRSSEFSTAEEAKL